MPGADERLSQPAGRDAAVHRGRLLHHRRRVPPRRRRLPLFRRPHRRHVRLRRREHLSGRRRAHAGAPSRRRRRPWWSRSTTTSRAPSRWPSSSRRPATSRPKTTIKTIRAGQRAGLSAPALRLVRRRIAARLDQQGRSRGAAQARAGARGGRSGVADQFVFKPDRCRPPASSARSPRPCSAAPVRRRNTDTVSKPEVDQDLLELRIAPAPCCVASVRCVDDRPAASRPARRCRGTAGRSCPARPARWRSECPARP